MAFVAVAMMFAVCFIGFTVVGDEGADAYVDIGGGEADATVLLTIDTTDITKTTTSAVCGVNVTVSGNDVTVTGTLEADKTMVVKGNADTNIVFNNFSQASGSKVEFTPSEGEVNTTDPSEAVANVSLGSDVSLTAVPYMIKEVTSSFVYNGAGIVPTEFPGILAKGGYSVSEQSLLSGDNTEADGAKYKIKTQKDVGTYVLCYEVTFTHGKDPTETYIIKKSWSITPLDVNITIDGSKVTKTYDGKTGLETTNIKSGSKLITIVSADASSKNVADGKDIKLVVSSGEAKISNFTLKYGGNVLKPTEVAEGYEVTLTDAVTINPKSIASFGASQRDLTYNGEEQEVTFAVTGDGFTLTKVDYDLGGVAKAINAGTYTATVTGKGNFTGTISNASWTIGAKSLTADSITATPGSLTYNKSSQTVSFTVKDGDKPLTITTDYTVTGNTQTDAESYEAKISGAGNYKDDKTVSWTIAPKKLTDDMITLSGTLTYKGTEQDANIKVTDGTDLTAGTHYDLSGVAKATDAGTYKAKIVGKGNYTGEIEKEWTIGEKEIGISWYFTKSDYSIKDKGWEVWSSEAKSTYDGTDQQWRVKAEATGVIEGQTVKLKVVLNDDKDKMLNAGSYTFNAEFDGEYKNYKLPSVLNSGAYTVEKKSLYHDYIGYYLIRAVDGKYYAQITVSDGLISPAKFTSTNGEGTSYGEKNRIEITESGDHVVKVTVNDSNWTGTDVQKTLSVKFEFTVDFYAYDGSLDLLKGPDAGMSPEVYYRYLEEHLIYLGFKTVPAGDTVALPTIPPIEGKEFAGWKSYAISSEWVGKEYYTPTYGYYEPKENVRLVAIYEEPAETTSLDYCVINALNYTYDDYTYNGRFIADANGVVTYVGSLSTEADRVNLMNDFARYMGALYRSAEGGVTSVYFNGVEYMWDSEGGLKGSNWTVGGAPVEPKTNTLVSAVTEYVLKNPSISQIVMEISNGVEKQLFTYGVVVYDDTVPKSARLIGAGFYQNADLAKLAMQSLGSTYTLGVSENTMFIVYGQTGYGGTAMKGVVTYNGNEIFSEDLLDTDGIRTWLFSDANQVKEKFVNGGTYTVSVYAGDEKVFSTDIYVTIDEWYRVTLEGEGVAFYIDGYRVPAGTYGLDRGTHSLIAETLQGYEGIPVISDNVKDGIFTLDKEMTIKVTGVKKISPPEHYTVTLEGYGSATVRAGESITLPTVTVLGKIFVGWSAEKDAASGIQGFYTPVKDVTLYPVFAEIASYTVSTDYKGDDVTLAYNSSIAKGSFGLLVVTAKEKVIYNVTLTNASLAALGDGSYMIYNVTGNVVISVTAEKAEPKGFQTFSVVGALADNKGFRVQMTSVDEGGLYAGTVKLTYTYSEVIEGKVRYASKTSDSVDVDKGLEIWAYDYRIENGEMYYAYAEYTYTAGEKSLTAQTLGVLAPSIPAVTVSS